MILTLFNSCIIQLQENILTSCSKRDREKEREKTEREKEREGERERESCALSRTIKGQIIMK